MDNELNRVLCSAEAIFLIQICAICIDICLLSSINKLLLIEIPFIILFLFSK